jgi:hypothetical protein
MRGQLLSLVFGDSFRGYTKLVLPLAIGQLVYAWGSGFWLLARAASRGRALVAARIVSSSGSVLFALVLASTHGILGAVWGLTLGSALGSVVVTVLTTRDHEPRTVQPA